MLRTPLGTFAVTCSIGRASTNFVHPFGLGLWLDERYVGRLDATRTRIDRFLEILDCLLLAAETGALLVMEPTKLLQHLGVCWVTLEDTSVRLLGGVVLLSCQYVI